MTTPTITQDRTAYDAAQDRIQAGLWRVDPDAGLLLNRRGKAIGRCDKDGYLQADLRVDGRQRSVRVHRVIWETVHGPIPDGMEINHGNGVKADNRVTNLETVTHEENLAHARAHGLINDRGCNSSHSKLTPWMLDHLRRVGAVGLACGLTQQQLTQWYPISQSGISRALNGRRYR